MSSPILSVVIINWNAKPYVEGCLNSVFGADYPRLEIILVDNASTDGSPGEVRCQSSPGRDFLFIRNQTNIGAAGAANVGLRHSHGKYVIFMASDTQVGSSYFGEIVQVMERDDTIGGCESKIVFMADRRRLDSAGEYLTPYGFLFHRIAGQEIDQGQFDFVTDIFSGKGTGLSFRRSVLDEIGGYDEDYFMFLEETDLCWRVWLAGYRMVFVPQACIYHASGVSISAVHKRHLFVKYYGARNYVTTLLKNLGARGLVTVFPLHISLWLGLVGWLTLRGRLDEGWHILKGIGWNLMHLGDVLHRRRRVQKLRKVPDRQLFPKIMRSIGFRQLLCRATGW